MQQSNGYVVSMKRRQAQLSRHAQVRSQQRGLCADAVPVITSFGERSHDGRGGVRYLMTDKAMAVLIRAVGRNQRIDALAGAYVVLDAETESKVITIGHRYC
jgi:hypothetical protein